MGEKMSDDEVDELLKAVDTSSGEINYVGMFIPDFPSLCAARTNTFSQTLSRPSSQTKHLFHLYTHPFSFSKQNTILGALARDMKHGRRFFSFTLFNSGTRMNYIAITFGKQYRILYSGNYTSTAFLKTCLLFLPSLFCNAACARRVWHLKNRARWRNYGHPSASPQPASEPPSPSPPYF